MDWWDTLLSWERDGTYPSHLTPFLISYLTQTSSTLTLFFLAMVLHPAVQTRAREEIISYFRSSSSGSPLTNSNTLSMLSFSESEKTSLPYTVAVLRELLRWGNITPTSLPHATSQEDVWNGWRIPKEGMVVVDLW